MSGHLGDDGLKGNLCEALGKLSVKSDNSNETTEIKSPPNLSDMPNDVVSLIIERSDYKEQLILRKVSKSIRSLVDKSKSACQSVSIECYTTVIRCYYNNQGVTYATDKMKAYYFPNEDPQSFVEVYRDDYEKVAFEDLKWTLNNPKLELDSFSSVYSIHRITMTPIEEKERILEVDKKLNETLKSLNGQLSVKTCRIRTGLFSSLLTTYPKLKPGILKKVVIDHICSVDPLFFGEEISTETNINFLFSTDQWKQAEEFELIENPTDVFPMKYATHFKRFALHFFTLSSEKVIDLANYFSKLDNFELGEIHGGCGEMFNFLWKLVGTRAPPNEKTDLVRHYPIPDSDDYMEIQFLKDVEIIIIEKKTKKPF